MKTLKTVALISIVSLGMTSSVFASWWNPITWKIFKKEVVVTSQENNDTVKVSTTTFNELTKDSLIFCNGSKYRKCPENQKFVCPTNGDEGFCEKGKTDEIKTPKVKESSVGVKMVDTKKIVKTEKINYNYLYIDFLNKLVLKFDTAISYGEEIIYLIDKRLDRDEDFKNTLSSMIVNDPTTTTSNIANQTYKILLDDVENEISYLGKTSSNVRTLNSNLKENKKTLEYLIDMASKDFFSEEKAISEMKNAMKLYDGLEIALKTMRLASDGYYRTITNADNLLKKAMTILEQNISNGYAIKDTYRPAPNIVLPTFPVIEMPKTTYCNTRYTGIQGSYDITCNTR